MGEKKIGSRQELDVLREKTRAETDLRSGPKEVKITVHMGTCGIAAGGREVLSELADALRVRVQQLEERGESPSSIAGVIADRVDRRRLSFLEELCEELMGEGDAARRLARVFQLVERREHDLAVRRLRHELDGDFRDHP